MERLCARRTSYNYNRARYGYQEKLCEASENLRDSAHSDCEERKYNSEVGDCGMCKLQCSGELGLRRYSAGWLAIPLAEADRRRRAAHLVILPLTPQHHVRRGGHAKAVEV